MFTVHCDCAEGEQLLSESQITGMVNTDSGILVAYRCSCGRDGAFLTGRRAERQTAGRHLVHQLAG